MSSRKVCRRKGHKWHDPTGMRVLPLMFCKRAFCSGMVVAPWCPPSIAPHLDARIKDEDR